MTENKRFYIGNGENCTICDNSKGGSDFFNMLTQYQAVDLLNELNEENTTLKEALKELREIGDYQKGRIDELHEENQQLKNDDTITDLETENAKLTERNEELRKDNLKAFALLGTVRAYIRLGNVDDAIEKINKFEKEMLQ